LPGIRVAHQPVSRTAQPERTLQPQARVFMSKRVEIRTGPYLTVATRAELGVRLAVPEMSRKLLALGRSGNPFLDLSTLFLALFDGLDFSWLPVVDRVVLGRYVQAIRRNVERPPIAGATDGQGWSIAGVAGTTLDTVSTVEALEQVLRRNGLSIDVPLREVPAPQALAIGSPDAVLYGDDPENTAPSLDASHKAELEAVLSRVRPPEWLPEHGKECDLDPGYQGFCQGPRRVPRPVGAAAQLAHALGLGEPETVGHLLGNDPKQAWMEAAGSPPPDDSLLWPVPGGQLWRGFGYVRTGEYKDKLHRGVDIGAPRGTPIVAINDGVVAYSDNRVRGYGNLLVIIHGDGSVSLSAHCIETFVFPGQHVRRGQIIGAVGDTGFARGTHVHFEYHRRGRPVDPQARFVQPRAAGSPIARRAG
jgi:murein DD-endopeptidase MepM/ murein hydrolase activator NlpD